MPITPLKVQKTTKVSQGEHPFTIEKINERTKPYHYIDVYFRLTDVDILIKDGFPARITEVSKLGKLLISMKVELIVDEDIDLESTLIGKQGILMTKNEVTPNGTFARVVDGTVKFD